MVSISQRVYKLIVKISFCYNFEYNVPIMSQFCACHYSSVHMAHTKLWHDPVIVFHVRATPNFTRFGLWAHKSLVKLVPGARPTNDISIEFEILPKYTVFWFQMYSTDHNKILHTSRQCNCRDVCKISLWSVEYILNQSTANFGRISNWIEISLVGWAPALLLV